MSSPAAGWDQIEAVRGLLVEVGVAGCAVIDLDVSQSAARLPGLGVVQIGFCRAARLDIETETFDILLCGEPSAPRPWVGVGPDALDEAVLEIRTQAERNPVAAVVVAQALRLSLNLTFDQALWVESIGYSMLLASSEFKHWRAEHPARRRAEDPGPRVLLDCGEAGLTIELIRASARNAFDGRMRDELVEALEFAAVHPDAPPVTLFGRGPAFSAGGDLDEFGKAADPGLAHLIRTARSPTRLIHQLGNRITAVAHGACVGAGIETPAAAARLIARPDAVFRLPEVSMGLIPGAGGVASIPRRIGRHRACFMAISGRALSATEALAWGLVDAVEP